MIAALEVGCQIVAWFADPRHADILADSLRAGGAIGVRVIEGPGVAPGACDGCGCALEAPRCCEDCAEVRVR